MKTFPEYFRDVFLYRSYTEDRKNEMRKEDRIALRDMMFTGSSLFSRMICF